jgi:pilus assembly protein CpaC
MTPDRIVRRVAGLAAPLARSLAVLAGLALAAVAVPAAPAAAQSVEVVETGDQTIALTRHQGVLVRTDRPISSVFVAEAEIADVQVKSSRLIYVYGKKPGTTTLFAVDGRERVVVSERLEVRHDLERLTRALRKLSPASPIEVSSVGDAIALSGNVGSPKEAEDARVLARRFAGEAGIINRLQVASPTQVNLRVRVAEVSRTVSKNFGVRWNALLESGGENFNFFSNGTFGTSQAIGPSAVAKLAGSYGASAAFEVGSATIDSMLDILASEGLATILSEPNLTAMSGETATLLAGGEFPIPIAQDDDGITVEFKEFGVRLEFTPTLLDNGQISLAVAPEVSELAPEAGITNGFIRIPGLRTRRAVTTVELASGQSFAIAGLLENTRKQNVDKLPGLSELPILGALFRSDDFQRGETELAIIITPYIVEPVSGRDLAAPTDGLLPPNDIERIFFGRMHGRTAAKAGKRAAALEKETLTGPVGFILD